MSKQPTGFEQNRQNQKHNSLDWHTEDENGMQDGFSTEVKPSTRLLPRWLIVLGILLLLILAGLSSYRYVQRQMDQTLETAREDVLASHRLLQEAATRQDGDLFHLLLADDDPDWVEAQTKLFEGGVYREWYGLGLAYQPEATANVVDVSFSPDLTRAEVIVQRPYSITTPAGLIDTIILQQTAVYRYRQQRWLLAPIEAEFWGNWVRYQAHYLSLTAPQRDAEIARRLALAMDVLLTELCQTPGGPTCTSDHILSIQLDTAPDSLVQLVKEDDFLYEERPVTEIVLPTPTLIGLPPDEAGYQALYRAYAGYVTAVFITNLVDWECCQQAIFHHALLDQQLYQAGLRTWPLAPTHYRSMFYEPLTLADFFWQWQDDNGIQPVEADRWPIYALVEFLSETVSDLSPLAMQQGLLQADNYWAWLEQLNREQVAIAQLEQTWLHFAYAQALSTQISTAATWPEQAVALSCGSRAGYAFSLYDPASNTWTLPLADRQFRWIGPLAGGQGVLVQSYQDVGEARVAHLSLWQQGEEQYVAERPPATITGSRSASGKQWQAVYKYTDEPGHWLLLDQRHCDQTGCLLTELPGSPHWSPNGHYLILAAEGQLFLAESDGQNQTLIGEGLRPFWLDDDTYGYLLPDERNLVITQVNDKTFQTMLPWENVISSLPDAPWLDRFYIGEVAGNPSQTNMVFLAIFDRQVNVPEGAFILSFDRETNELSLVLTIKDTHISNLAFSPDGRWLSLHRWSPPAVLLHDVNTGEDRIVNSLSHQGAQRYAWSQDSRWLVRVEETFLHFINPGPDPETGIEQHHITFHDLRGCSSVSWMTP
jgi:hypothetical protein